MVVIRRHLGRAGAPHDHYRLMRQKKPTAYPDGDDERGNRKLDFPCVDRTDVTRAARLHHLASLGPQGLGLLLGGPRNHRPRGAKLAVFTATPGGPRRTVGGAREFSLEVRQGSHHPMLRAGVNRRDLRQQRRAGPRRDQGRPGARACRCPADRLGWSGYDGLRVMELHRPGR